MVIEEIIPYVDSVYRTKPDRKHRKLIGYSAGGRGVMSFLMKYPELFSAAVSLDGAFRSYQDYIGRHPEHETFFNGDEAIELLSVAISTFSTQPEINSFFILSLSIEVVISYIGYQRAGLRPALTTVSTSGYLL